MPSLYSVLLFFRSLSPSTIIDILSYTRTRNRLDACYQRDRVAPLQQPGNLLSHQPIDGEIQIKFENAELRVQFLSADLVHLSWSPGEILVPYAIAKTDWEPVEITVQEESDWIMIGSPDLKLMISQRGEIDFLTTSGNLLRKELAPSFQLVAANELHPEQVRWVSQAALLSDEAPTGLGEHSGRLNLRGQTRLLWNTDPGGKHGPEGDPLYMPLPVYHVSGDHGGYLIFFENSSRAWFSFDTPECPGMASASFSSGALRYYFCVGSPPRSLARFTELTGRAPLPPKWSLGYHQSRWGYKNDQDIRRVVSGFSEHSLPLDAIHLDIDYMSGYRVFTVDTDRFPDLGGLADELHNQGIRLIAIIDPGVKKDEHFPLYQDGYAKTYFLALPDRQTVNGAVWPGDCVFPDFTHPAARTWWGELYQRLLEMGVDSIWHDMNEPATFAISGGTALPLSTQHDLDGHPGDHLLAHNIYGLQMNRAAFDGLRLARPDRRPWILSRSGWIGNARYAWNWTADVETSWAGLRQTVTSLIGMGLSGIPFSGSDIGGFTADPPAELYLRWFQMATFNAFMRTHSAAGLKPREPWVFGEPYTTIIHQFLFLRKRLMAYIYTTAWQATQTGAPLIRPLSWADPGDPGLWSVEDAFLFGDALLVAPVLSAGASERTIRLPQGVWHDFWSDRIYQGSTDLSYPVNLEQIPVLVRNNTLIPLENSEQLELHLYTTGEALSGDEPFPCCQIYSDAGEGYTEHRVDNFRLHKQNGTLNLQWLTEGEYDFPYSEIALTLHGVSVQSVDRDGQKTGKPTRLIFKKPFNTLKIEVNNGF